MDANPLEFSRSECTEPEDADLMVKGLPQLSLPCATITVSSNHVLKKASKKLAVSIHGYEFTSLDGDDVVAAATMHVPPHRGNPLTKKQDFFGEWSKFRSEAKESACLAALTYLKQEGLIVVHDTNYSELKKYKQKFEAEHFWSSELYVRVCTSQAQLAGKTAQAPGQETSPKEGSSTPPPRTTETATSMPRAKKRSDARPGCRRALFIKE